MKNAFLLLLLLLPACVAHDPVRIQADRANLALATRLADGWFGSLPHSPDDVRLVRAALADWSVRLDAEERAAGVAK